MNLTFSQAKNGEIIFKGDIQSETIWATQNQISELFEIDQSVVSRHISKIKKDEEIDLKSNMQKMHIPQSDKPLTLYSLDIILAIGYKTNSKIAIRFRRWATSTLKSHLIDGYTINKNRISHNYAQFMKAVDDIKSFLPNHKEIQAKETLELITLFATTWMSLDAYDTKTLPLHGVNKSDVNYTSAELSENLTNLKQILLSKEQATELFGQEKQKGSLEGIVGNIFQTFGGEDLYPTLEEKAAHLLYFIVKNHPFNDGNKRCGAFAFIWFLKKATLLSAGLTPQALTTLTLLVAQSDPKEKERLIGLILLLLRREKT